MESFRYAVECAGLTVDALGVAAIILGLVVAAFRYLSRRGQSANAYRQFRQDRGRGILLGLELLVAADIIRTVAVAPTLQGVLVLGVIVLIRPFLSFTLEVELEGRWPRGSARRTPSVGV